MATLLYEQAFAPGPSNFCQIGRWELLDVGANDSPDPLYPEMVAAESNDVSLGGGPSGENCLTRIAGGDAGNAGCWFAIPGPASASPGNQDDATGVDTGGEGWAEVCFKVDATYLADMSTDFAPIMTVNASSGPGGWFLVEYDEFVGPNSWKLTTYLGTDFSYTLDAGSIIGTWYRAKVTWKSSAGTDGYIRFYLGPIGGETLIYDHSNIFLDASVVDVVKGAYMGFAGMLGPMTNFRVYSGGFSATPSIDLNNSAECCASPGVEGKGIVAPGAGVERPVLMSAVWTGRCTGGGTVVAVADLTDAEDWSDS